MSVAITGQQNYNGLILYCDMNNPNSYAGEPTTNLNLARSDYTGTSYSTGGEWTSNPTQFSKAYYANVDTPIGKGATLCAETSNAGYYHLSSWGGGGESGAHSLSCYICPLSNITNFTIGLLNDGGNMIFFDFTTETITYGGGISNRNAFIQRVEGWPGWYRVGANMEGRSGGWVGSLGLSTNTSYTPSTPYKSFYITGIQYEYKDHITAYVSGSRSVTQGLLDLTKGSTLDLTNTAFNASGRIDFGSNKVITAPMTNLRPTAQITQECWFSTTSNTAQVFIGAQYGNSSDNSYALWIDSANTWAGGVRVGGTFNYSTYSMTLATNVYYNFVHTYDGSNQKLYINGSLVKSWASSGTISYDTNNTLLALSNDWNSGYNGGASIGVIGTMPVAKIYNRALTSEEILQNYNRVKKRYGL